MVPYMLVITNYKSSGEKKNSSLTIGTLRLNEKYVCIIEANDCSLLRHHPHSHHHHEVHTCCTLTMCKAY